MAVPTLQFEAKVRAATRRSNKSGDWWSVTLEVHPSDFDEKLCAMAGAQQQVMAVIAAVGDDGQPKAPEKPKRPPAITRAEKARRLCGVPAFWDFIEPKVRNEGAVRFEGKDRYEVTSNYVKWHCCLSSKGELDTNPEKAKLWDALLSEYEQSTGRMAEKHQ